MRVGELIGRRVVDQAGRRVGVIMEVRALAGPGDRPALYVDGLVVAKHNTRLLGYERAAERGPAILVRLVRWLHRDSRYAEWDQIDVSGQGPARLRVPMADLARLSEEDG